MVVGAQPVEEIEDSEVGAGPVDAVVELQERHRPAPLGRTGGVEPLEGRLLGGPGAAAHMLHPHHRLAPGHHRGQEGVGCVHKVADGGDRHGAVAGHLAHLPVEGTAPQ
ncbi:MAG: hypothetical protein M3144_04900 [Actinomycetota bacterium]|nr:hypothetical protein [Actinomycetota bacterium]